MTNIAKQIIYKNFDNLKPNDYVLNNRTNNFCRVTDTYFYDRDLSSNSFSSVRNSLVYAENQNKSLCMFHHIVIHDDPVILKNNKNIIVQWSNIKIGDLLKYDTDCYVKIKKYINHDKYFEAEHRTTPGTTIVTVHSQLFLKYMYAVLI